MVGAFFMPIFTEGGGRGFLTNSLVTDFQNEYPPLRIKPNSDYHDRLIVLDYGEETERVYHCGASSKDAGKKLCAISACSFPVHRNGHKCFGSLLK